MPTHIKNIIKEFLKDKKEADHDRVKIERIINENLGEEIKKHIRLQKIYKKTIFFSSESSSASYEFGLHKNNLLEAVKKEFPYIEGIVIKIG